MSSGDIRNECIKFFQKLCNVVDNDADKAIEIEDIGKALNFDGITTRKIMRYLGAEGLVESVGQSAVCITHKGIKVSIGDRFRDECIQFFQKLYEIVDNDTDKAIEIENIGKALNFDGIITRKIMRYLGAEGLVKSVGQSAVCITREGIRHKW